MITSPQNLEPKVYQGQFGQFTITNSDRSGVIVYRTSLLLAALSFALASWLVLSQGSTPTVLKALTPLYAAFCLALGISLVTIHIYMASLHRVLQVFWGIGASAAIILAVYSSEPLALYIYNQPLSVLGIGFTFAALTGIYFKEAFCFNRLETKFLSPLVPLLLLGHLASILPIYWEQLLLGIWAVLFMVFAIRKLVQPIPDDIGDKSVFDHLQGKG
ncbi:MAG: DUF2301 domain-containing membrane protein [Symploca sp. SIO3C6]|uniref:DUF2301 domain-containing membrane protein n=1 Tax=Symploca sp. SIO1C4 TaxID=2607765 RepID=A0A6B3NNX5_9CYAN|nr:DUF2301 domain-containing membrane protein [Symploca sp. SIO3C6]NER31241.1 DUF2301 domain-containing membrane protein [Symploca sp. SIO1C4]NET05583.1 DUF2301 domain-containing membrane protein [Symploca sp. SIO2B6]